MKPSVQCMDPSVPPTCSCSCSNGITFTQTLSATLAGGSQPSPDTCQADNEQCLQRENNCKDSLAAQTALADQLKTNLDDEEHAHATKLENQKNQCDVQEQAHTARQTELEKQLETTKQQLDVARSTHTGYGEEWNRKPFTYLGCYQDNVSSRILTDLYTYDQKMTRPKCANICRSYSYYGLEYGAQCFCGNTFRGNPATHPSKCDHKCVGDTNTSCGGQSVMAIFQKRV